MACMASASLWVPCAFQRTARRGQEQLALCSDVRDYVSSALVVAGHARDVSVTLKHMFHLHGAMLHTVFTCSICMVRCSTQL